MSETRMVRQPAFEHAPNFRDLGGYACRDGCSVKWRTVFRSGHLAALTDRDLRLFRELAIGQVHDFRRDNERELMPSRLPAELSDVARYNLRLGSMQTFHEQLKRGAMSHELAHSLMMETYRNFVRELAPEFSRFLHALVHASEAAVLFHCSAGKDRTGMAAALLLTALDVPRETVLEDYLLTRVYFPAKAVIDLVQKALPIMGAPYYDDHTLLPYCGVDEEYLLAAFDEIDGLGGSARYLEERLGLSHADRETLKRRFTEPAGRA